MSTKEDLNFKQVAPVHTQVNLDAAASILGVLRFHASRPKDDRGVADITLRQLVAEQLPQVNGLFAAYVRTFGAHGESVIRQYVLEQVNGDKATGDDLLETLDVLAEDKKRKLERHYGTAESKE